MGKSVRITVIKKSFFEDLAEDYLTDDRRIKYH